ncbi:uncharacterized protein LOC129728376 [Wyeomyia smithii]|uniref:uncharacterized protein LOC129728376 n=1 Tax=Wyeomyia smithii TaxID=174621 RepID=UPI0024682288|nr:uncharacterized protein LOC129728376 [Wyeomyia smithii]
MNSLNRNQTWVLTKLPAGKKLISCEWVFKVKSGANGEPDRYKARLVARGFTQRYGYDYTETYAPVARLNTLRAVLAVANQEWLLVHQMDVRNAFRRKSIWSNRTNFSRETIWCVGLTVTFMA